MEERYVLLILFLIFFGGLLLSMAIYEAVQKAIARHRRKKQYIKYLETRNAQLERRVNFYRLQSEGITAVEVESLGNVV